MPDCASPRDIAVFDTLRGVKQADEWLYHRVSKGISLVLTLERFSYSIPKGNTIDRRPDTIRSVFNSEVTVSSKRPCMEYGTRLCVAAMSKLLGKAAAREMIFAPFAPECEWSNSRKDHAESNKITSESVSFRGKSRLDVQRKVGEKIV